MTRRPASPPPTPAADEPQGVTLVISWAVQRGREEEFEELTHEIAERAREFCGHDGVTWLRPHGSQTVYHSVLRFTDEDRLMEWVQLPERQDWLRRVHEIAHEVSTSPPQTTGTETWFSLPEQPVKAPPKWKATLMTMLGAYPVSLLINWLLSPHLGSWPLPLRALAFPVVAAPLLTFLIMPRLSRLFRNWLYPDTRR
ncbi:MULTISPECIES: antibiotic biosynthesis monooxygenase [Streptomyces]|uniref:antibiotic biosynthesis monooxygenase n=1 Tax=Streptomyces TaxID=1883 RepID=UPI002FDB9913